MKKSNFEIKCELPLREYQIEALEKIEEGFQRVKSLLISIPTGGGKTIIFNTYALSKNYRTLVIAHRDELIEQALDKYVMIGGAFMECGKIVAGKIETKKYTAGSIQSIHRNLSKLENYFRELDLVVWDEAHHVPARTYREVYERIREVNPEVRMLGVTATPFRMDGKDLKEFFEEMVFSIGLVDLIKKGYLVPLRGRRIPVNLNLDLVRTKESETGEEDFSAESLGKLIMESGILPQVARLWQEFGENRRTIFFLPSVESAKALAEEFNAIGVPAKAIHGGMSLLERRKTLQEFKNGQIRVLTNVNVLTEGFDDPEVDCIALLRPTKSLVLYAQMVGRGLRLAKGKKDCLVLDFTGISAKHEVAGLEHLFGLEREDLREVIEKGLAKGSEVAVGAQNGELKVLIDGNVEEFDFEGKDALKYATILGDRIFLSCGLSGRSLVMERAEGSKFRIWLVENERMKLLKENLTEDYAWSALNAIWKSFSDEFMLDFSKRGKGQKPTEKQIFALTKAIEKGILPSVVKDLSLSRLDASNLLSYAFAVNKKFYKNPERLAHEKGFKRISEKLLAFYSPSRNVGFIAQNLMEVESLVLQSEAFFKKSSVLCYHAMKLSVQIFLTTRNIIIKKDQKTVELPITAKKEEILIAIEKLK